MLITNMCILCLLQGLKKNTKNPWQKQSSLPSGALGEGAFAELGHSAKSRRDSQVPNGQMGVFDVEPFSVPRVDTR